MGASVACYSAATCYYNGTGRANSLEKALVYLEKACSLKDAHACYALAEEHYNKGAYAIAISYYEKTCELEDTTDLGDVFGYSRNACMRLAIFYDEGKIVPKDPYKRSDFARKGNKLQAIQEGLQ